MLIETIFKHLFEDKDYFESVYPHLKPELFLGHHQELFKKISHFTEKYKKSPSVDDIKLMIDTDMKISENVQEEIVEELGSYKDIKKVNTELAIDQTEEWVKNRSMEMAILESVEILEGLFSSGQRKL